MKYGTPLLPMALFWMLSTRACPASPGDVPSFSLTNGCESCHGSGGQGYDVFPPINRLGRQPFIEAMHAFKEKQRSATVMGRIAGGYTDSEIKLLADLYSSVPASCYKAQK